jgi:exopolysaccharide biosynthesis polyprenyl glycosylphosphotransferase
MPALKRRAGPLTIGLVLADALIAIAVYLGVSATTITSGEPLSGLIIANVGYLTAFVIAWWLVATDEGLMASQRNSSIAAHSYSVAKAGILALAATGFLIAFFSRGEIDRGFFITFGLGVISALLTFRMGVRFALWAARRSGFNYREILIVGANDRVKHLVEVIKDQPHFGYHLVGVLDPDRDQFDALEEPELDYLGPIEDAEKVLRDRVIDEVYICLPIRTFYKEIVSLARLCEGAGVPVRMMADLFPLHVATRRAYQLEDIPFVSLSTVPEFGASLIVKRALDLIASGLFLILVAWWLFPAIALLIKFESRGPIFFTQERVGLNQRTFRIIKFRTMILGAEEIQDELTEHNEADGPVFKIKDDPRVTRVGRWLRKTSLDEFPQFMNVLIGDMSLVGPRPPLPGEVDQYTWDQRRRLSVRPGVTGLQQVSGRSGLAFEEWIDIDLAYIDHWNLLQDWRILLRTVQVVVEGKGAS